MDLGQVGIKSLRTSLEHQRAALPSIPSAGRGASKRS